jgi:hypothetical protein
MSVFDTKCHLAISKIFLSRVVLILEGSGYEKLRNAGDSPSVFHTMAPLKPNVVIARTPCLAANFQSYY